MRCLLWRIALSEFVRMSQRSITIHTQPTGVFYLTLHSRSPGSALPPPTTVLIPQQKAFLGVLRAALCNRHQLTQSKLLSVNNNEEEQMGSMVWVAWKLELGTLLEEERCYIFAF